MQRVRVGMSTRLQWVLRGSGAEINSGYACITAQFGNSDHWSTFKHAARDIKYGGDAIG